MKAYLITYLYSKRMWMLFMMGLILVAFNGCANDETVSPPQEMLMGANQRVLPNSSAVGALVTASGTNTGCSVAFLNETYAITAARCIEDPNPSSYQVVLDDVLTNTSQAIPVATLIIHPLWNSSEIGQSRNHVTAVQNRQAGYYTGAASYDLAVLSVVSPKLDGVYFEPIQRSAPFSRVETLYFSTSATGVSRTGNPLNIANQTISTLTALEYSLISSTKGGGAAMISLDTGRAALVGVASGGDGQGIMFTKVSAHFSFIGDIINGAYSANVDTNRYLVEVEAPPVDPNMNTQPDPGPTDFDCSMMSDGFCDSNCRSGEDFDCRMVTEMPTGSAFGTPCNSGADCLSRLCVGITEIRFICSAFCNPNRPNDCPNGFSCVEDTEGDYLCGPTQETVMMSTGEPTELRLFGADCSNDDQCSSRVCISHQGQRWCSQRCMNTDECPISYVCGAVTGGRACIPPQ